MTISPHPDPERMAAQELRAAIAAADEKMRLAREAADLETETWFLQERRLLQAEIARRNGQTFTSDYKESPSEVKFEREINAAELQRRAKEEPGPALTFLPLLGQERFIVKGWSHLLAAYPKAGKTELLIRIVAEWPGERVLYLTEEQRAPGKPG